MASAAPQSSVDLNSLLIAQQAQMASQLTGIQQQGIMDNQRLSQYTQLAFTKDLLQSGQESNPGLFAGLNAADRTPVVKAA